MIFHLQARGVLRAFTVCWGTLFGACAPQPAVEWAPPAPPGSAPDTRSVAVVPAVLGFTLTVSDLERSERFFQALDFSLKKRDRFAGPELAQLFGVAEPVVAVAQLQLGQETVELRQFETPAGRALPTVAQSNELSFQHMAIVVSDMNAAYRRVQRLDVHEISHGPQTLPLSNPAAGGIRAFYFRDAEGHALELIQFPRGKGARRWHEVERGLFLGIDHTAIVVADTDLSAPLYEALGFGIAGRSLNFGVEQERLSGVPGARVRITGFAARSGPGVEFLSYLEPAAQYTRTDARANDIGHWEVTVRVPDVERALAQVVANGGRRLSDSIVDVRDLDVAHAKAVVVHDRDGHGLRLVQP